MKKIALISGISGQDGSYLAELLISKNYTIHGMVRKLKNTSFENINHLIEQSKTHNNLFLHEIDITNFQSVKNLIEQIQPDEIYNLAAHSNKNSSFENPIEINNVISLSTLNLLESIRILSNNKINFCQASSGHMFDHTLETRLKETDRFNPKSPYACAKVYSHHLVINYRENFNIHASNAILFNHESPRRREEFVTRKITKALARICHGKQDKLYLGNIDIFRDWGFAGDYVFAMWLMLQKERPDDYVIATGKATSVREFCKKCFDKYNMNYEKYVITNLNHEKYNEIKFLVGNPKKANNQLLWKPKITLDELINIMTEHDYSMIKN